MHDLCKQGLWMASGTSEIQHKAFAVLHYQTLLSVSNGVGPWNGSCFDVEQDPNRIQNMLSLFSSIWMVIALFMATCGVELSGLY